MALLNSSHHDERRHQILDVATKLFAAQGFQTTTMDHVAAAVGFTKPIIYQHFESKDALYSEIVASTALRLMTSLAQATAKESTARGKVEAAFVVYFTLVVEESDAFRVLFLQHHTTEQSRHLRNVETSLVSFIEPLLDTNLEADHKRQIAGAVVGMAEGAAVVWLVRQANNGWPTVPEGEGARLASRIATLAWGGLRTIRAD